MGAAGADNKNMSRLKHLRLAISGALLTTALVAVNLSGSTQPSAAQTVPIHASEVSIFFYPWYGSFDHDKAWAHWDQKGHRPGEDIGANFYPRRGAYSSSDVNIIQAQMQDIAAAGIDTVVVSWWGQGTYEDKVLDLILAPAQKLGLNVAAHVEPPATRNSSSIMGDYQYLRAKGIRDFYIYQAQSMSNTALRAVNDANNDDRIFGEAANEAGVS